MTAITHYIVIRYDDRESIVQYATSLNQALKLIKTVMPPLRIGYEYGIIKKSN